MNTMGIPVGSISSNYVEQQNAIRVASTIGKRKFIRLIHNEPGSIAERVYPVDGVIVSYGYDEKTHTQRPHVIQREGEACLFIPDEMTGIREAYLLDTEYNRKFLASHLLEDRWTIEDPKIEKEIRELAKRPEFKILVDTTKMKTMASQQMVVTNEAALSIMTDEQKKSIIAQRKKELEELEKSLTPEVEAKKEVPAEKENVRTMIPKDVLKRCTDDAHKKFSITIMELKKKHGEDYKNSDDYRKIQAEIDMAVAAQLSQPPK